MIPVPVISLPITPPDHEPDLPSVNISVPDQITVRVEQPVVPFINTADLPKQTRPLTWDDYVGQEPIKQQLRVYIDAAKNNFEPLPHTLFASGMPGVGKTTLAEIAAAEMGSKLFKMQPPFTVDTLVQAAIQCGDHDVLFIDEALALDTPIPTPTGWSTVGELTPGDEILGANGLPTTVIRLTPIATDHDVYRVTFTDGASVLADAGHKWYAQPKINSGTNYLAPRVVTTTELAGHNSRWSTWRMPAARAIKLPEADLPVDPYILGQWLGNGNVGTAYINVRLELHRAFKQHCLSVGEAVTKTTAAGIVARFSLTDIGPGRRTRSSFRQRMEDLGIYNTKAIPDAYLRGSIDQRLALVRGLMDTDGYVAANGHCTFSNTNERIIDGMMELLQSLGYVPTKNETRDDRVGARGEHQQCWKVEFQGDILMNPFWLRDADKVVGRTRARTRRVVSVERVQSVPVRCIEVDAEDHLFLAGAGMVVTHNCHKMADNGPAMAEALLPIMEERVTYINGSIYHLCNFTVIGATTDAGKLPRAVRSRFAIEPFFQRYTIPELIKITKTNFADRADVTLTGPVLVAIAKACRRTPREARKLVVAARALQDARKRYCTPEELLAFKELEPDGTTRQHIAYLTALFQFFGRERVVGEQITWEYVAGEMSLMNILDENKPGLAQLERFLIEQGLVDRTPRGRRLTERGIVKAREYVARGQKLATG